MATLKLPEYLFYREEPIQTIRHRSEKYQFKTMHVGAVNNKLDNLREVLASCFDPVPGFRKIRFLNSGEVISAYKRQPFQPLNTEYELKGKVNGVEHIVSLEFIEMSATIDGCYIHHAAVGVHPGKQDYLSAIIKKEFKKYQREFKKTLK
ncbi:hypothetical protein JW756_00850 [Candidatus Woesearchaeota archaeon]|nr:hypothetical protein [Candidatus Woesearchaeota archaeon]